MERTSISAGDVVFLAGSVADGVHPVVNRIKREVAELNGGKGKTTLLEVSLFEESSRRSTSDVTADATLRDAP